MNCGIVLYKIYDMEGTNKKIALITGASSGIGRAAAKAFAKDGYIVYGTSRSAGFTETDLGGVSCMMIPMELADEDSVRGAVEYVIGRHGRIDVVVNAAGSGIAGAVEDTSAEEARKQFDVCFFGVIRVLNHVLPRMRAAGGGMIINVGSMASCFPLAFQSMYGAAKSALLMMTAALRMEVRPFCIKACVVEPGDTKTGFTDKREFTQKTRGTAYKKPFERALYEMIRSELSSPGPEKCAETILRVSKMKNPPVRVSVGLKYKFLYILSKFVPLRFRQSMLEMMYLSNDPPKDAVWTFDRQFK